MLKKIYFLIITTFILSCDNFNEGKNQNEINIVEKTSNLTDANREPQEEFNGELKGKVILILDTSNETRKVDTKFISILLTKSELAPDYKDSLTFLLETGFNGEDILLKTETGFSFKDKVTTKEQKGLAKRIITGMNPSDYHSFSIKINNEVYEVNKFRGYKFIRLLKSQNEIIIILSNRLRGYY